MSNFFDPFNVSGAAKDFINPPDPAKGAQKYYDQVPGVLNQGFNPYIQKGNDASNVLNPQYQALINDPSSVMNKMGSGYQQSPGYQFKLQQALQAGNNAFAAGGMSGSPMHQQQNMDTANGIASQDYNDYMTHIMGLYGKGMEGEEGIQKQGFDASGDLAEMMSQSLMNQGNLAYAGTANQNATNSSNMGALIGLGAKAFGGGF